MLLEVCTSDNSTLGSTAKEYAHVEVIRVSEQHFNKPKVFDELRAQVDRLLDLRHGTRLDHIDAAFDAMGTKVDVSLSRNPPA